MQPFKLLCTLLFLTFPLAHAATIRRDPAQVTKSSQILDQALPTQYFPDKDKRLDARDLVDKYRLIGMGAKLASYGALAASNIFISQAITLETNVVYYMAIVTNAVEQFTQSIQYGGGCGLAYSGAESFDAATSDIHALQVTHWQRFSVPVTGVYQLVFMHIPQALDWSIWRQQYGGSMPRLDGSYPHIRRQAVPPVQDNQDEDNFFEDLETLADGSNPRVGSYSQSIFLERNVTYILEMTGNGTSRCRLTPAGPVAAAVANDDTRFFDQSITPFTVEWTDRYKIQWLENPPAVWVIYWAL